MTHLTLQRFAVTLGKLWEWPIFICIGWQRPGANGSSGPSYFKEVERDLDCPLNFTRLDPLAEWFAEVWTALSETKAVFSKFSGPIHDKYSVFFNQCYQNLCEKSCNKSRYSCQINLREIQACARQGQESPLVNNKGLKEHCDNRKCCALLQL